MGEAPAAPGAVGGRPERHAVSTRSPWWPGLEGQDAEGQS